MLAVPLCTMTMKDMLQMLCGAIITLNTAHIQDLTAESIVVLPSCNTFIQEYSIVICRTSIWQIIQKQPFKRQFSQSTLGIVIFCPKPQFFMDIHFHAPHFKQCQHSLHNKKGHNTSNILSYGQNKSFQKQNTKKKNNKHTV